MEFKCLECGRDYIYKKKLGHQHDRCNSCVMKARKFRMKEKVLDFLGGKCFVCDYNKCRGALECHHLDPSEKEYSISLSLSKGWRSIKKELEKCILLCSNCHREFHHNCDYNNCNCKVNKITLPNKVEYNLPPNNPLNINEPDGRTKNPMYGKIYGSRKDYWEAMDIKRFDKNKATIDLLLNSEIDFNKLGWVSKAALILNIKPQKVSNWMKRNMKDFYNSECFIRCKPRIHFIEKP